MKESFLLKIAKDLSSEYPDNMHTLVLVFPSRRASLFFSEELLKLIDGPIWLPMFLSIDDFTFNINNIDRVNKLELFFHFYNTYSNIMKTPHDIDRCYAWSDTLLQDFDDIDKSCVNSRDLFSHLSDLKRIENWYLDIDKHQQDIQDYLGFFKSLPKIYTQLKRKLLEKRVAYSGLAQRLLAENPETIAVWLSQIKKQKIIFVGLDALTISQEKIIDYCLKRNLCDVFWDTDSYFLDNLNQDSGYFLRKYIKKWPKIFKKNQNDFLNIKREINIIGSTKSVNQVKLLASLLRRSSYNSEQLKRVAIILPNEDLLLSVIESIPKEIQDINITMGYKIKNQPVLNLFHDIIDLHVNSRIIITKKSIQTTEYLNKDILKLLYNPYFELLLNSTALNLKEDLIRFFGNINFNYISTNQIKEIKIIKKHRILKDLFSTKIMRAIDLIRFFQKQIPSLLQILSQKKEETILEEETLCVIQEHLELFLTFFKKSNTIIDTKLFRKLFIDCMRRVKLNFSGEPLSGLQIMGLLESRTIDFEEVFVLSANENNLPPSSKTTSFIPFDIKRKFNITTNIEQDSIYANHFFNLIKRPKIIHLIYDQDLSSFYSGERSRFINQLLYEIKQEPNHQIVISEKKSINHLVLELDNPNSILKQKDKYVINKLITICKNGLSPSTINLYNYCKTQFYFEKVLDVPREEEVKNNIDSSIMGLIIHKSLENLYRPHCNFQLNEDIMISIKNNIDQEIKTALIEYKITNIKRGKNLLAFEAITRIIRSFIDYEYEQVRKGNEIIIKFLEYKPPLYTLKNSTNNQLKKSNSNLINIKGSIDRIDIFNGNYRIIDYKTGFVSKSDLGCKSLSEITLFPKVLQLLIYALLFKKSQPNQSGDLFTGVINLRAVNFDFQFCRINKISKIDDNLLSQFEFHLIDIIEDMLSPGQNFKHLDRDVKCVYCD